MSKAPSTTNQNDKTENETIVVEPQDITAFEQEQKEKSIITLRRKRYSTAWKQQQLPALRLRLAVTHVLLYLVCLGVSLIICGSYSYIAASDYPPEIVYDYTNCVRNIKTSGGDSCSPEGHDPLFFKSKSCTCHIEIEIDNENLLNRDKLILYYEITNFHQNLRRYKVDVDWYQLAGKAISNGKVVKPSGCRYDYYKYGEGGKVIFPCGKVASAYFSDVFKIRDPDGNVVTLDSSGIAWPSDVKRFQNPSELTDLKELSNYCDLPKNWHDQLKVDFVTPDPVTGKVGVENERFIVWMRTSTFDLLRNKYAYISGLKKGKYQIEIEYRYEVMSFDGKKRFVIAAESFETPVNSFFYIWSFTVAALCIGICPFLFMISFILKVKYRKNKTKSEHEDVVATDPSYSGTVSHPLDTNSSASVGGSTDPNPKVKL